MADAASEQSDGVKPWTIKGVPPDIRNAIIAHANREKMALGEWIARAGRAYIQSDRNKDKTPVVVGLEVRPQANLSEIERVVTMASQLAAAGAPPPKAVSRLAYNLLKDRLGSMKAIRPSRDGRTGSQESPTEIALGPTSDETGPTEEASGQTNPATSLTPHPPQPIGIGARDEPFHGFATHP